MVENAFDSVLIFLIGKAFCNKATCAQLELLSECYMFLFVVKFILDAWLYWNVNRNKNLSLKQIKICATITAQFCIFQGYVSLEKKFQIQLLKHNPTFETYLSNFILNFSFRFCGYVVFKKLCSRSSLKTNY